MVGYERSMSNELAILAGGDDHELAVNEIREHKADAWTRLTTNPEHQHFLTLENNPCVHPPLLPVPRQSPRQPSSSSRRRREQARTTRRSRSVTRSKGTATPATATTTRPSTTTAHTAVTATTKAI